MIKSVNGFAKFFIKTKIVGQLRSFLLFLFGRSTRLDSVNKILIVNFEGIGDMVAFTSVLKHYRGAFPDAHITLLMKESFGLENALNIFVHDVLWVNYKKFAKNPWYGYKLINALRSEGFHTAIAHDHAAAEFMGKIIALSVGARETITYEGFRLQYEKPFDENMQFALHYVEHQLFPRFTKVIPSIDRATHLPHLENVIDHYRAIYEHITGRHEDDYATELPIERFEGENFGNYVVINLGSSQSWKNWPVERFLEVAQEFEKRNIRVVLIGAPEDRNLAKIFTMRYHGACSDLTGRISIGETIGLIAQSQLVFSNDTSATHIAIALKKPTVTVLGVGHLGSNSFYGYGDINVWVYVECACMLDNWRCTIGIKDGESAPCISAIGVEPVLKKLRELLDYMKATHNYPEKTFLNSFYHNGKNI